MSQGRSSRRYQRSFRGLIGAMLAVLLTILVVWGLTWFQRRPTEPPGETVQYTKLLAHAREVAPFHVLAPEPEPSGWRATSASYTPTRQHDTWHLGFLTRQGQYVGLAQSTMSRQDLLQAKTRARQGDGAVTVAGHHWRRLTSADGKETALVRTHGDVTVLVTGTAGLASLKTLVRSLR